MKLKKLNAVLALLSILLMLAHVCYSAFAYLTFYYNPLVTKLLAVPFIVVTCLHAVLGMSIVFTQADGTRAELYPKKNLSTILQRLSAALIFPLLILHINTFDLLRSSAENRQYLFFAFLILMELLFFAAVITHVAVSFSKAFVTLGLLTSDKTRRIIDKAAYIIGGMAFAISAFAVIKGQLAMFLS